MIPASCLILSVDTVDALCYLQVQTMLAMCIAYSGNKIVAAWFDLTKSLLETVLNRSEIHARCIKNTLVPCRDLSDLSTSQDYITRNNKDAWSSEKILTVLAGSMLAIYSVTLGGTAMFSEPEPAFFKTTDHHTMQQIV